MKTARKTWKLGGKGVEKVVDLAQARIAAGEEMGAWERYQRFGYCHAGYEPPRKTWVSRLEQIQARHEH